MSEHTSTRNKILETQVKHEKRNVYRLEMEAEKLGTEVVGLEKYNFSLKQKLTELKNTTNKLKYQNLKTKQKITHLKSESKTLLAEIAKSEEGYESFKVGPITNNQNQLLDCIQGLKVGQREKAIFINISQALINTTINNEFSDMKWKAVFNSQGSKVGMRIKFFELAMLKTDVDHLYEPIINAIKKQYEHQGVLIKVNFSHLRGMISNLDFYVYIDKKAKSQLPNSVPEDNN